MLNSIDNKQMNVNFQGKLINKTRFKFGKQKFEKIAKYYEKMTEGMSDMYITSEKKEYDDFPIKSSWTALKFDSKENYFDCVSTSFNDLIKTKSEKYVAALLAKITKTQAKLNALKEKNDVLEAEINRLEGSLAKSKYIADHSTSEAHSAKFKYITERTQAKIDKLKEQWCALTQKEYNLEAKYPSEVIEEGLFFVD